jgi:hypothetical protein
MLFEDLFRRQAPEQVLHTTIIPRSQYGYQLHHLFFQSTRYASNPILIRNEYVSWMDPHVRLSG